MRSMTKHRPGWLLCAVILLALPMCVMKPVGGFAPPADLERPPLCFWEQYLAMIEGEPGPFPCVEDYIAMTMAVDCENDAMVERETSLVVKCRE